MQVPGTDVGGGGGTIISSDGTVSYVSYRVKTGDTLESIATEYKTSVAILIQLNGLAIDETGGSIISVGQVLQVPSKTNATANVEEYSNNHTSSYGQTIRKRSQKGVTVGHPYAQVEIATETGMLTLNQNLAITSKNFDGDILAITTSRDLGNDCPTFSLRIVYRHNWYDIIGSNDLVAISLCRPPEKKAYVFFGLVDDIRKTTDFSTGQPVRSFDITGRGFNKALVNFSLGAVSEVDGGLAQTSSLGWMGDMVMEFAEQSPVAIIKMILQHYLTQGCDYHFANGTTFLSYYQQFLIENTERPERLDSTVSFLDYQGSLWQLLKEVKNAPFNEMFWEVYNDKPTLIVRPTPFNQSDWNKLQRIQIKDQDIINENLGRSDLETYVVYSVKATSFIGNVDIDGMFPLWYKPYYSKYGINRLQVTSKFLGYGEDSTSVILGKQHDIFNWNIKNNAMENGTITIKGSNLYKIGMRIILESTGMEYYVENVSHNFTLYQSWTTTLSVTRGLLPNNRFTAPWGMGVQMQPSDLTTVYGYDVPTAMITLGTTGGGGNTYTGTPGAPSTDSPSMSGFLWPLSSGINTLSSLYGGRIHPITHKPNNHLGIDIPAAAGTDIYAAKAGKVTTSTYHNSYGNYVVITHDDGTTTLYAHMSQRIATVGQTVTQGQVIGLVGTTGSSTGNHLHFEIKVNGSRVDPVDCFQDKDLYVRSNGQTVSLPH